MFTGQMLAGDRCAAFTCGTLTLCWKLTAPVMAVFQLHSGILMVWKEEGSRDHVSDQMYRESVNTIYAVYERLMSVAMTTAHHGWTRP